MSVEIYIDIEKILKSRGITLTQLSDRTGIDKGNLSRIKSKKPITFKTLNKIASALGEEDPMSLISVEVRTK
ncbi:DNA-binding Xre family transcriptional regulator [Peribacillus simplex]